MARAKRSIGAAKNLSAELTEMAVMPGVSEQGQELVLGQTCLVQDRQQRSARNIFALWDDHEADSTTAVIFDEGSMTSLSPVRGFHKSISSQHPDDLFGGEGRQPHQAEATSNGVV